MVNKREREVLYILFSGKKLTYEEISKKYNISNRSARYYINNINFFLSLLNCCEIKQDGKSLYIDLSKDYQIIHDFLSTQYHFLPEERRDILLFILLFDKNGLN